MLKSLIRGITGSFSALIGRGRAMLEGVFRSRIGDPPIRGTREFLEVYETSPTVRGVFGRIATSVGATKWTLEGKGRPITDHVLLTAFTTPNALMSGHQLFKITQLCLDLVGDAFWFKVRNGLGAPVEFYPIPPHWIAELPTPLNPTFRIAYYGWQERIPDTEIFWIHDAAPADPYRRGSGTVRAMADELETAEYASKHAKQIFWNRAIPEFVVMDPGASGDDIAIHEQAFSQKLQGFWRWYKPYFSNRKLEFWQPQQMNLDNLTMVPLMQHERDVIYQTVGMPPEQMGLVQNSNRATIDGSDYVYESRIVKTRREFLRDAIQSGLVPEYDSRLTVDFVNTVPEDKDAIHQIARSAPHILSLDEWRELMGADPIGGPLGASRIVPLNSYITTDPLDQTLRPQPGSGSSAGAEPAPPEPAKARA